MKYDGITGTPFQERNRTTDGIACWFDSGQKNLAPDAVCCDGKSGNAEEPGEGLLVREDRK